MNYPPLQFPDELPDIDPQQEWVTRKLPGPVINGVTYTSHTIELYWKWTPLDVRHPSSHATGMAAFYMRMTHGGGTFLYKVASHLIESVWNQWATMPDEALYAVFYTIWNAE